MDFLTLFRFYLLISAVTQQYHANVFLILRSQYAPIHPDIFLMLLINERHCLTHGRNSDRPLETLQKKQIKDVICINESSGVTFQVYGLYVQDT